MSKLRFIILIILFLLAINSFAQKETNNWFFSTKLGLDFNNDPPIVKEGAINISIDSGLEIASMSDKNVNLLFYTEGNVVYNKNHTIMQNGNNISGRFGSNTNSVIIIPKPNNPNAYYIFVATNKIVYSEVDMSMDGGLGAVTSMNSELPFEDYLITELTATITQNDITVVDITENNSITVINPNSLGSGNYWFALESEDGSVSFPYQDEPVFNNLKGGVYTLFVEDKNGCGTATLPISVIGYPKFFTPNNDGINDFWQIQGINEFIQADSSIQIFDRYGKLLKQLIPSEVGWDGTFNGSRLSVDDYWFHLLLKDGRTVLGHFALKR